MARSGLFLFLAMALLCGIAVAQSTTTQNASPAPGAKTLSARVVTLSGTIAEDCKTLLAEKNDTRWTIMNPDALKGHEGHQVTLKGRVEPGKTEIQVFKVRMKPEAPSAARLGDSAFRR